MKVFDHKSKTKPLPGGTRFATAKRVLVFVGGLLTAAFATVVLLNLTSATALPTWLTVIGGAGIVLMAAVMFAGLLLSEWQFRKMSELAGEDYLTTVGNQRALWDALGTGVSLARRHSVPLSVILLDLNNFKEVNDHYGHSFGDQVLRQTAKAISANCRGSDQVFRYGGDEFIVICPYANIDGACELAKRVDEAISSLFAGNFDLSACFGVAELGKNDSGNDLVDKADVALLTAKKGKNKIVPAFLK